MSLFIGSAVSSILSFILTFLCMKYLPFGEKLLGHDRGRLYAPGSEVNIGKPTGVGFYFILVSVVVSLIFTFSGSSYLFIMILVLLSMLFGFLDDRSRIPGASTSRAHWTSLSQVSAPPYLHSSTEQMSSSVLQVLPFMYLFGFSCSLQ